MKILQKQPLSVSVTSVSLNFPSSIFCLSSVFNPKYEFMSAFKAAGYCSFLESLTEEVVHFGWIVFRGRLIHNSDIVKLHVVQCLLKKFLYKQVKYIYLKRIHLKVVQREDFLITWQPKRGSLSWFVHDL